MHALINGGNINYIDSGNARGTPVVFVHGFPFSHEMWKPQLDAVGRSYRTIAYDIRGHGLSDIGDGQYSIESHVDDLFGLIDHLNLGKVVIVGLSMGGYITLRALEREQNRFLATVLCDTRADADSNEGKIRRFASVAAVKKSGSAAFAENFVKAVFAPGTFSANPAAIAAIRTIIERTPPLSIAGTQIALASRTDTTGSLSSIRIPTLILVGEQDVTTPPEASRFMHERIPGSELHIVPTAAHMSNLENTGEFNGHLLAFLQRVAPPR
jgi:3-oxoadipate enol-lactonase